VLKKYILILSICSCWALNLQRKKKIVVGLLLIGAFLIGSFYFYVWNLQRTSAPMYEVRPTPDAYFVFADVKRTTTHSMGRDYPAIEVFWRVNRTMPDYPAVFTLMWIAYAENGSTKSYLAPVTAQGLKTGYTVKVGPYTYYNLNLFPEETVSVDLHYVYDSGNVVSDVVRIINLDALKPKP